MQEFHIDLKDYFYELTEDKIAKFPVEPRDTAKLQVYTKGEIIHTLFCNLADFLPEKSFLFFNKTKVIPARMFFQKQSGAVIEIFLLEPKEPTSIINLAMQENESCVWECMIGNKKRWKNGEKLIREFDYNNNKVVLSAEYRLFDENYILFSWNDKSLRWVDILELFGEIPLPPYFKRKPTKQDSEKYQTIYAKEKGAVAAPTAGLHFTDEVLEKLERKAIKKDFLTLHVGAGTFQPIKVNDVADHKMHSEQVVFSIQNVKNVYDNLENIIAVGTTSMRALESLYWFGIKLMTENDAVFSVKKLFPYNTPKTDLPNTKAILENIIQFMEKSGLEELIGETEIFIFPGYEFKICKGIITNYHLPETTLILLVAAFIGKDWRTVYNEALNNEYRFLSYGDSSLLLP